MKKGYILIAILGVLFYGCGSIAPIKEHSLFIVWRSPAIKYADMGFLSDDGDRLRLEIYSSGTALMRIDIDRDSICMSRFECMEKRAFNQKVLSPYYPPDTLESILRAEEIFGGEGVVLQRDGFVQKISEQDRYSIEYRVNEKETIFIDTLNNIVIKIRNIG